jgi:hypothetical protein
VKRFYKTLALTALVLSMIVSISGSVNAVVINGDYEIEFLGVEYDPGTNLQTWTYNISCINDQPGISHVLFEFKTVCDPPLSTFVDGGPVDVEPGYDPTTEKTGIKFETGLEAGEWVVVWFVLEGEWPVGTIEAWVKAGNDVVASGIVTGPECRMDNTIPEIPLGTVMAGSSMLIALVGYVIIRKRGKN